jgi:glycine cleavage system regulatory protein
MTMNKRASLVLTVIGPDRPGIVEAISRAVTDFGANWEESRMARLANRFAGILRVTVEDGRASDLAAKLESLSTAGLRVVCDRSSDEPSEPMRHLRLDLVGNDRPGIVREIAQALASRRVNIEELETECSSAAESGNTLFKATARLAAPSSVPTSELRQILERLAADLMVDIQLDERIEPR